MIPVRTKSITDNYVDTMMSVEIGNYMTEELSKVIPGVVVLVKQTAPRYANPEKNPEKTNLGDWMERNYENELKKDGSTMDMSSLILIPLESVDSFNFEEYKETIVSMFDNKLYGFGLFVQNKTMIYIDDNMLEEMLEFSGVGDYDSGKMVMVIEEHRDIIPRKLSIKMHKQLGFKYSVTEILKTGKYEFLAELE